jgi:hypothetical protein
MVQRGKGVFVDPQYFRCFASEASDSSSITDPHHSERDLPGVYPPDVDGGASASNSPTPTEEGPGARAETPAEIQGSVIKNAQAAAGCSAATAAVTRKAPDLIEGISPKPLQAPNPIARDPDESIRAPNAMKATFTEPLQPPGAVERMTDEQASSVHNHLGFDPCLADPPVCAISSSVGQAGNPPAHLHSTESPGVLGSLSGVHQAGRLPADSPAGRVLTNCSSENHTDDFPRSTPNGLFRGKQEAGLAIEAGAEGRVETGGSDGDSHKQDDIEGSTDEEFAQKGRCALPPPLS